MCHRLLVAGYRVFLQLRFAIRICNPVHATLDVCTCTCRLSTILCIKMHHEH